MNISFAGEEGEKDLFLVETLLGIPQLDVVDHLSNTRREDNPR